MNPLIPLVAFGWLIRIIGLCVWVIAYSQIPHAGPVAPAVVERLIFATIVVPLLIMLPGFFKAWKFLLAYVLVTVGTFTIFRLPHTHGLIMLTIWGIWTFLLFTHPRISRALQKARARLGGDTRRPANPVQPPPATQAPAAPTPRPAATGRPDQPPQSPQPPMRTYDFTDSICTPRYSFANVIGMAETKKRLLAAARDIVSARTHQRNGILLFGEPGNGKTMFAEALAGELKVPFFSIAYSDIASMWVNESVQKVKAAFAAARRSGSGVFFIDEIDSFLKDRSGNRSHHMDRDMTNTMLTEIVSLRGTRILLVAATNHLDDLDSAGVREKRFDFKVEIPAPDQQARQAILRRAIGGIAGYDVAEPAVVAALAERWAGFSAARLSAIGEQIGEMRLAGEFAGKVTFDIGMRALRVVQGRKGKLPETVKGIDEILMPEGSRNVLKDLAFKMANVYALEKMGSRLPTGLIFVGPPGTGKTQAAMALAKQADCAFLKITGAEIMAKPDAWDRLFRTACDIRPAIVFLDEADGILRDRQFSNYGMLTEKILTTIDGAGGRVRDLLFIAATNHHDRIDSAALRGGRFEEKIVFDVPAAQDMQAYIRARLNEIADWTVGDSIESLLVRYLRRHSIADADAVIQKTVDAAAVRRLREDTTDIRESDVEQAVKLVLQAPNGAMRS
ncbi:ATP-binding protein [Paraburkholderia unamae]|uniref:ATP-binding protein n=1 Tax=Paraburkholderia unamae TaxID=219649 RepID=UPI000DD43668|nr:ATP-binding protein [Paraburkholderia unamae]